LRAIELAPEGTGYRLFKLFNGIINLRKLMRERGYNMSFCRNTSQQLNLFDPMYSLTDNHKVYSLKIRNIKIYIFN